MSEFLSITSPSQARELRPDAVVLLNPSTGQALGDALHGLNTVPANITTKFREAFEEYLASCWVESKATGDIVVLDGNAVGASYLVISKDPLSADSVTSITSAIPVDMPIEMATGLHLSQRTLGQEFSVELVSDEAGQGSFADLDVASLSQATTILTVNTSLPHGLKPGMRIGIYGCADSRMNYPSLVVASIPAPTQFTATAGPGGTLPSLTAGPFTSGMIYMRSALGYARNGSSMIFENATATNASFYARSASGDAHPAGGTLIGNHAVTIASTASIQAINAAYTYAFAPTTEYRLMTGADRLQWADVPVDSTGQMISRAIRTQVVPDPSKDYRLRFRCTNNKGLTVPSAQIVSVVKSGSTTATVVFDRPHGLTTADWIVAYGVRDQTNFANLTVATAVTSVVNATTITVVWGTAVTATSYGGYVARVQGGNLMSSLGASMQSVQTAVLSSGVLTLVGSAAWAGLLIGDYVNAVGVRDTTGTTLDIDGAYRVRNIATTSMELAALSGTVLPADFALVDCGSAVIQRTALRISFVRIFDYERERVELLPRPASDAASAAPVVVQNTVSVTASGTMTATQGTRATLGSGWYVEPDNLLVNDVASAALTATTTTVAITPTPVGGAAEFNVIVSAVSGTTPTLDLGIEESDDSGTNWYRIYDFPRITAAGAYRTPVLSLSGNRLRYVQTVGGTSPSFTRSVNRITHQMVSPAPLRQIVDRAVVPNTLNAVTPSLKTNTARSVQLVLSLGAVTTTPPVFQLEGSDDNGATWYAIGAALAGVPSSTVQLTVPDINADLVRARVSAAGVGAALGYALLKAWGF